MSGTVSSNNSLIAGLNQLDRLWQVLSPAARLLIPRPLAPSGLLAYALALRAAMKKPLTAGLRSWLGEAQAPESRFPDQNPCVKGLLVLTLRHRATFFKAEKSYLNGRHDTIYFSTFL